MSLETRDELLDDWLKQTLKGTSYKRVPLTNDCSFRRYFRIYPERSVTSFVAMDAPPPEDPMLFSRIATYLKEQGLSVPNILASSEQNGFLLLSDLGDRLYLKELNDATAEDLYSDALRALITLQQSQKGSILAPFDRDFLVRQLGIFKDWYLSAHLKIEIESELNKSNILNKSNKLNELNEILDPVLDLFMEVIAEQPAVFVHRDYHSRNLMILEKDNPGILDFQDAMQGPLTYDLVSLLQDCYISWPRGRVLQWIAEYRQYALEAGLLASRKFDNEKGMRLLIRWFDITGVQRHVKNLGIFSRMKYRNNKPEYLKDIAMPLKYILEASERYPELSKLGSWLQKISTHKQGSMNA